MKNLSSASCLDLFHVGWQNYKIIKKRALDSESNHSSLLTSLSIAFFVIISSSYALSSVYYYLLFR